MPVSQDIVCYDRDDAEFQLTRLIGGNARDFISSLESYGPRICSDGWHGDRLRVDRIELRKCDCCN